MMAGIIGDSSPEQDGGKLQSMYQKTMKSTERMTSNESRSSSHKKGSSEKIFTGKRCVPYFLYRTSVMQGANIAKVFCLKYFHVS